MIGFPPPGINTGSDDIAPGGVDFAPQSRTWPPSVADVAGWLRVLMDPDPALVYELRALNVVQQDGYCATWGGTFRGNEIDVMARNALALSGACSGVYYVLNPLKESRHFRQMPRMMKVSGGQSASDEHVLERRRLLIDVDAVRAKGHKKNAATDDEKAATVELAGLIRHDLAAEGWPLPAVIDSGNGTGLVYAIRLPADDDGLVRRLLYKLADRFNTDRAKVDVSVSNPSRLSRLPGIVNAKGKPTTDRPHRCSAVVSAPAVLDVVPPYLIERTAGPAAPTQTTAVTIGTRPTARPGSVANIANIPDDVKVRRARGWLAKRPGSVQGDHGDDHAFQTAYHVVHGFDVRPDDAWPLMLEWNRACVPPWEPDELWKLRRKLDEADKLPGERGWKLTTDRDAGPAVDSPGKYDNDDWLKASGLCGPAEPACGKADCRPGCGCVREPLFIPPPLREVPGRAAAGVPAAPPNPFAALQHELVGNSAPYLPACLRRKPRKLTGQAPGTVGLEGFILVSCGCWDCGVCRTRLRWNEKNENIAFAYSRGTHVWRGTGEEWDAARQRLKRAGVLYSSYWVPLGAGERAAVLAVADESLSFVPADIPHLEPADGEQCARKLCHFINLIPPALPKWTKKFNTYGPLEWNPQPEEEDADLGEVGTAGGGDGSGEAGGTFTNPETGEPLGPFSDDGETPLLTDADELESFLLKEILPEQVRRKVPKKERVNPRRGTLADSHTGGGVEDSVVWQTPVDPDLIERIRRKLYDPPVVAPPPEPWRPSDEPIPD